MANVAVAHEPTPAADGGTMRALAFDVVTPPACRCALERGDKQRALMSTARRHSSVIDIVDANAALFRFAAPQLPALDVSGVVAAAASARARAQ